MSGVDLTGPRSLTVIRESGQFECGATLMVSLQYRTKNIIMGSAKGFAYRL